MKPPSPPAGPPRADTEPSNWVVWSDQITTRPASPTVRVGTNGRGRRYRDGRSGSGGHLRCGMVAADPHRSAASLSRSVHGRGHQLNFPAEQIDAAADGARGVVPAAAEEVTGAAAVDG